ncbi:MAG: hypothetical protein GY701_32265 [Sulfitobacter sp.]|nr:hypothetical protein [Sulfitobacter sp.]
MSVWFGSTLGQDLWNPSNRAAEFYLRGVRSVEAFIEMESGVGDQKEDEVTVDPTALAEFVAVAQERLDHPTMRAQVIGLLAISAVLLARSNAQLWIADGWEQLADEAESMRSRMPR